ncbi:hypothetical protein [Nocardioides bizhenqiangii]|uniref:Sensor domain-containing protein n=1 Tax=Nocardioides bizhenqiangii TaxID=3095076 RepID=A0ABZ0ZLE4_9ACTN|nr:MULTISPECIES: hypothetical protein [unclassified Nocardioides]MDZ5620151.1 hypothetical protein [Nocardioides sp. HM23]MDZ5623440.1 hypothetical protein [Nocardioides sp. HM23]WQQ24529.1 hypothetical protein SHK19_11145 [Nocardioides sp. HM61]
MQHVPTRPHRRLLATAASLALVSLLAVACGDDGGDAEAQETETVVVDPDGNVIGDQTGGDDAADDSGPALTQEQLEVVVLTPENVGEGWTGGPVESDDDSVAPGCFGEISTISDSLDPLEVAEHDVEYEFGDAGVPEISSGASSYEDGNAVAEAFVELSTVLSSCTSVTGTDSDGNTWDLAVSYDDTVISDATDDQINVTASGSLTDTSGSEYDLTLHQTYVRIGKNVITIGVTDFTDQSALHDGYTQIAIDRLIDVITDSEPDQTTGPQPV